MTGHPSADELAALARGGLAPPRLDAVLGHVMAPCESCLEAALAAFETQLDLEMARAEPAPDQDAEYEAAFDRVFDVIQRHDRHLRIQKAQASKILKRFEQGDELKVAEKLPLKTGTYAKYRALLDRSWALRHEDPARMVQLAQLATQCARQLDPRTYGAPQVLDFQCDAQAALGNAFRVAQCLAEAEVAMGRARELFELGSHSPLLEVRLLEREADLDGARRRFSEAISRLEKVYRYHRRNRENHLAAGALINKGLYTTYAGNPEKALEILRRSLTLIDAAREPGLAYAAMHNQVTILVDCRRYRDAERQLFKLRPLQQHAGGRINRVKLRWEEGRVDAGFERLERAEAAFREVREGMAAVHRSYDAALVSLDLAAVLMARRKPREAAEVVSAAYQTFSALRIDREGLASLVMLRMAYDQRLATRAMVEEVADLLRKLQIDPAVRFEAQAWGEGG